MRLTIHATITCCFIGLVHSHDPEKPCFPGAHHLKSWGISGAAVGTWELRTKSRFKKQSSPDNVPAPPWDCRRLHVSRSRV
ncbi:hypothetical protein IWW34DRAFT_759380 [Fusarium oxysporum f. sp. albedinis]|nr:hypothetical protein IWW34DRAFT_759380 [Fusarium oxysporum f. sp. albedinis]